MSCWTKCHFCRNFVFVEMSFLSKCHICRNVVFVEMSFLSKCRFCRNVILSCCNNVITYNEKIVIVIVLTASTALTTITWLIIDCRLAVLFYKFLSPSALTRHSETVHEGLKHFKCQFCPKEYGCAGDLNIHIRSIHEQRKDFHCEICDKYFTTKKYLNAYMQIHITSKYQRVSGLKHRISSTHEDIQKYKCENVKLPNYLNL